MFSCVRSSILANSVESFADVHICFVADNFYFLIFEKPNSNIGELSSRKLHSGTCHCPGMDLAGTRDISFHPGTVPGNLVTLVKSHNNKEKQAKKTKSRPSRANELIQQIPAESWKDHVGLGPTSPLLLHFRHAFAPVPLTVTYFAGPSGGSRRGRGGDLGGTGGRS